MSSSRPARRMSRSIRFATSPIALLESRATPSRRRRRAAGARVTLISGPVALADPPGCETRTCRERARHAGGRRSARCRRIYSSARRRSPTGGSKPARRQDQERRERRADARRLSKIPTFLRSVARGPNVRRLVVGFAAETRDVIAPCAATSSPEKDAISSSPMTSAREQAYLAATTNEAHLVSRAGVEDWPRSQGRRRRAGSSRDSRRSSQRRGAS